VRKLIIICPSLKISNAHHLIRQVLYVILLNNIFDSEPILNNILHLQLSTNYLFLLFLDFVAQAQKFARILSEVHDYIVRIASDENTILDGDDSRTAIVGDTLDGV